MGLGSPFLGLLESTFIRRDNGSVVKGRLLTTTQPSEKRDESVLATQAQCTLFTKAAIPIGVELLGDYEGRKISVRVAHFTPRRVMLATAVLGHQYSGVLFYLNLNTRVYL